MSSGERETAPGDAGWNAAPGMCRLGEGEVHLWRARLDLPPGCLDALGRGLSADEKERAARFHFSRDRNRFIAARGTLRAILAGYLQVEPERVGFRYNAFGKPFLGDAFRAHRLSFNLSHSRDLALYAVTRGRRIGVDLESLQELFDYEPIAQQYFAPGEVAALRRLPQELRRDAFFACWTRKEAYIKARGLGLSLPLDAFEVSLLPGERAALRKVAGAPDEVGRWRFEALAPGPGYVGALVVEGGDWRLQRGEWTVFSP